jgi:phthalate 4,5-dioxygenase
MPMSKEDNELLTRVTNGAPMGAMLREWNWIPACVGAQIVADGAPLRVRLFGERFVAFRSTDGRVGFFNEACPHRHASLALARNEDNALRCIYHGWKFSVEGKTVEVPTEARNPEAFCARVPLRHYPTREAGGIVWAWLGKGDTPPRFPDFAFTTMGPENRLPHYQTVRANWVQGLETTMDSSHASVLHQSQLDAFYIPKQLGQYKAPLFEVEAQPYGFRYAAIRMTQEGDRFVRISRFVLPWYSVISIPHVDAMLFFSVPIDDETTAYWTVPHRADAPPKKTPWTVFDDPGNYPPAVPGGPENHWGQDRALMKQGHFTGFPQHLTTEDFVVMESQGAILDRTDEYLNAADSAVQQIRRSLLKSVRRFMAGEGPEPLPADFNYADTKPAQMNLAPGVDWRER